jgi:hypothetical protein
MSSRTLVISGAQDGSLGGGNVIMNPVLKPVIICKLINALAKTFILKTRNISSPTYETKAGAYCQTSLLIIETEQLQTNVKQFKYTQQYDFFACDMI